MLPILRAVADGKAHGYADVEERMCRAMAIDEGARRIVSGKKRTIYDKISWARSYLKRHGLLADVPRTFQISRRGREVLKAATDGSTGRITLRLLEALYPPDGAARPRGAAAGGGGTFSARSAALVARGEAMLARGRRAAALATFGRAVALDATSATAHMGCGHAQASLGLMVAALSSFRRAVAAGAGHEAHVCCGIALLELGRPAAALSAFVRAAGSGGGPDAHLGRSRALLELGRCAEAQNAAALVIEARPSDAPAHIALGLARRGLWNHEGMLESFGEAVRAEPASAHAHACMAEALELLGRHREAEAEAGIARALGAGG